MADTREPIGQPTRNDPGPLVSVVIAAYNAADTVAMTLASALAQTHRNIEVIVVDDGSTDATASIVEAAMHSDLRVRLIRQPNVGASAARNTGLSASGGALVAPLDADDVWHPERVRRHVAALEAAGPQTALAYSPSVRFDDSGRVLGLSPPYHSSGDVFRIQLEHNLVGNGSGMTVRRRVLTELGGYPAWLGGSEDFHLQLLIAQRYHFVACPEYLVGYRKRPGSLSSDEPRMLRSRVAVLRALDAGDQHRRAINIATYRAVGRLISRSWRAGGAAQGWRDAREQTNSVREAYVAVGFAVGDLFSRAVSWVGRRLVRPPRATVATIDQFLRSPPLANKP